VKNIRCKKFQPFYFSRCFKLNSICIEIKKIWKFISYKLARIISLFRLFLLRYIRFIISRGDFAEGYKSVGGTRRLTSRIGYGTREVFFPRVSTRRNALLALCLSSSVSLFLRLSISRRFERETADRRPFNRVVESRHRARWVAPRSLSGIWRLGAAIGAGEYRPVRSTVTGAGTRRIFIG